MANPSPLLIGCAAGFSGDRLDAAAPVVQALVDSGRPGVLIFETLAERSPDSMLLIDSSIIRAHQQAATLKGGRITPSVVLVAD